LIDKTKKPNTVAPMNMSRIFIALLSLLLSLICRPALAGEYTGNKMLEILGEERNSEAVSKFRTQYILDKTLKNPELGVKLMAGHDSVSIITAIMICASGNEIANIKYKQFEGALPFSISLNDDEETLSQKLGNGKGLSDDNKVKYKKDGITINVYFKSTSRKKISYIKFSQNIGMTSPYRLDGSHQAAPIVVEAPVVAPPAPAAGNLEASAKMTKINATKAEVMSNKKTAMALPTAVEFGKANVSSKRTSKSEFYNAIMNVIESGEEELFKDIKKGTLAKNNFWNYKYTYATSVAIPGEKYNMIYSFPFQNSQLDFVSVLEETDGSNGPIESKYAEIEAKLKEDFRLGDGWTYHYTLNQEDPKGLKDFEVKNSRLGSIVLDSSINPYGKHVLYLRFLLQYN